MKNDFISQYFEYTKEAESPDSYFRACAYATISAVLRDHIWYQTAVYRVYPNMYTLLLSAESSNTRKDYPISVAENLIRGVDNTHVIVGTATIPGVIKLLGEHHHTKKGKSIPGASGIIVSDELTAFTKNDYKAVELLTSMYTYKEEFSDTTKGDGRYKLEKLCLSILAASNEALVEDLFTTNAREGGLLARTCVISESKRRFQNSLESSVAPPKVTMEDMIKNLNAISTIRGPIRRSQEASEEFTKFYAKLTDDRMSKTGVEGRIHDTVRKIAMVLAVNAEPSQDAIIRKSHMEQAIEEGYQLVLNQKKFSMGSGSSVLSKPANSLIKILYQAKKYSLSKAQIMRRLFGDVDKETLEKVIDYMVAAEYIGIEPATGNVKLTAKCVDKIETKIREKQQ